jgi:carbon-monoxide dehydrogenase large subunit
VLAREKVVFVGQPVAAVVAETPYQATDGLNALDLEYELLPTVTDPEAAVRPGSSLAALMLALEKLKQKATEIAARLLQVNPSEVVFASGRLAAGGWSLSLRDVARAAHHGGNLPAGMEPGLSATASFDPKNFTFPFGAHICVVEVDVETGEIRILRYVAVDDCGRVVNPLLVDGQIHGGIAQGIGQALLEEIVHDDNGQLLTGSLLDYALPRAPLFPWFETDRTVTPTDVNPLGAKGVGESGAIGATPALVNAVVDALEPFGVRHIDPPLRAEKVWRVVCEAAAQGVSQPTAEPVGEGIQEKG